MQPINQLIESLSGHKYTDRLLDIYIDPVMIPYQENRYIKAIHTYKSSFGSDEVEIYSAPGRSEIGGNHTDHQHGEVLAASINLDAIAIVKKLNAPVVKIISDQSPLITINLDDIEKKPEETGTTCALIKGVLMGFKKHGYRIGGFQAYLTSDVLIGAGLSSSAAFETLIGTILSGLYNSMHIPAMEIARIGQYAENEYFEKPCGLMDQMACSVGSLIHIDFADPISPVIRKIEFDLEAHGYSLCITDTKGSHADLTADYAAIPAEMKKVASVFGKEVLRDITMTELLSNLNMIRQQTGDRAVLRALHFFEENIRVQKEAAALQTGDLPTFLSTVKESGDSSFKYLQNVYTGHDISHQNLSIALAVSDCMLKENGVSRVHGGGFAGTIQAFVTNSSVRAYKNVMDDMFGKDSCHILKVRKYGGIKVIS